MTHLITAESAPGPDLFLKIAAGLSEPIPAIIGLSIGADIAHGRPGAAVRPRFHSSAPLRQIPSGRHPQSSRFTPVKLQSVVLPGQAIRGRLGPLLLQLRTLSTFVSPQVARLLALHCSPCWWVGPASGSRARARGAWGLPLRRTPWTTTWRPTSPACSRPRANRPSGEAPHPPTLLRHCA